MCVCVFVCFFPGNYRFVTRQYEIGGMCCPVSGWGCFVVVVACFFVFFVVLCVCVCVLCAFFPGNYRFVTRQYEIGGKCCPVSSWGCFVVVVFVVFCCFFVVVVFFCFFLRMCFLCAFFPGNYRFVTRQYEMSWMCHLV